VCLDQRGGEPFVELAGIMAAGERGRPYPAGDDADGLDELALAGSSAADLLPGRRGQ